MFPLYRSSPGVRLRTRHASFRPIELDPGGGRGAARGSPGVRPGDRARKDKERGKWVVGSAVLSRPPASFRLVGSCVRLRGRPVIAPLRPVQRARCRVCSVGQSAGGQLGPLFKTERGATPTGETGEYRQYTMEYTIPIRADPRLESACTL